MYDIHTILIMTWRDNVAFSPDLKENYCILCVLLSLKLKENAFAIFL